MKPAFVFVHGIANGPDDRIGLLERIKEKLRVGGSLDSFRSVHVAPWESSGDFLRDLLMLQSDQEREHAVSMVHGGLWESQLRADIDGAATGLSSHTIVCGHSMGQPLAIAAMLRLAPLAWRFRFVSLGGPCGNPWARPYLHWLPQIVWGEQHFAKSWDDVYNTDDPVCGGVMYAQFRAARSHRIVYPGFPSILNPLAEHSTYLDDKSVHELLRALAR